MSLLDELGVNPEDFTWEDFALCGGIEHTNLFFEDYDDEATARQVDEMCLSCPVMKQCHQKGKAGQWGVWGAVYWNGSGKPEPMKNAHKTDEVWEEIDRRVSS